MVGRPKGTPKSGGRQKGTPNKATAEIKELARKHGPACIKRLAKIAQSEDDAKAIPAIRELLDRGYGRAAQPVTGEDGPIDIQITWQK